MQAANEAVADRNPPASAEPINGAIAGPTGSEMNSGTRSAKADGESMETSLTSTATLSAVVSGQPVQDATPPEEWESPSPAQNSGLSQARSEADGAQDLGSRGPAGALWSQMLEGECQQFDGKPIQFSMVAENGYIEGKGTLRTVRHPDHAGLCSVRIVVILNPPMREWEFHLPPDAVAMIVSDRWDENRFVLRTEE